MRGRGLLHYKYLPTLDVHRDEMRGKNQKLKVLDPNFPSLCMLADVMNAAEKRRKDRCKKATPRVRGPSNTDSVGIRPQASWTDPTVVRLQYPWNR